MSIFDDLGRGVAIPDTGAGIYAAALRQRVLDSTDQQLRIDAQTELENQMKIRGQQQAWQDEMTQRRRFAQFALPAANPNIAAMQGQPQAAAGVDPQALLRAQPQPSQLPPMPWDQPQHAAPQQPAPQPVAAAEPAAPQQLNRTGEYAMTSDGFVNRQAGPVRPQGSAPGSTVPGSGFDMPGLIQQLYRDGLYKAAEERAKEYYSQQHTIAETGQQNASAEHTRVQSQQAANAAIAQATGYILSLPPEQRPAAYLASRQKLHDDGHIDNANLLKTYPGDQQIQDWYGQTSTQEQVLSRNKDKREAAEEERKAGLYQSQKLEADTKALDAARASAATELEAAFRQGGMPGFTAALAKLPPPVAEAFAAAKTVEDIQAGGLSTDQRRQRAQAQVTATELNRSHLQNEATARKNANTSAENAETNRDRFNATIGNGLDDQGHPLPLDQLRALALQDPNAVAISEYRAADPSIRTPSGAATMRKVYALDQKHDGTKFPERSKIVQDYSASGKTGKEITSADTALAHLDRVSRAGKALETNSLPDLNAIAQEVGARFGGSARNVYESIVGMVAPEIARAVIGESGEAERQAYVDRFKAKLNDRTREQTIGATADLLWQRIEKKAHAYEVDMDKPFDLDKRMSEGSKQVMRRYGLSTSHTQSNGNRPSLDSYWIKK